MSFPGVTLGSEGSQLKDGHFHHLPRHEEGGPLLFSSPGSTAIEIETGTIFSLLPHIHGSGFQALEVGVL